MNIIDIVNLKAGYNGKYREKKIQRKKRSISLVSRTRNHDPSEALARSYRPETNENLRHNCTGHNNFFPSAMDNEGSGSVRWDRVSVLRSKSFLCAMVMDVEKKKCQEIWINNMKEKKETVKNPWSFTCRHHIEVVTSRYIAGQFNSMPPAITEW